MAASKAQRIGIWIIAAFMAVGTIGSFAIIVLANSNEQKDQARVQELSKQYQDDMKKQADELSAKYYSTLDQYRGRVAAFDAASVTELKTEDLAEGTGDPISETSNFTAYYIGWNPDGKIFDSSFEGETLKAPFDVVPGGVIEGWTKGAAGMKVGGVRELTLPSDLAYKETGSGELIPPNTPLKFIVLIIPTPEEVPVPQELLNYSQSGRLQ